MMSISNQGGLYLTVPFRVTGNLAPQFLDLIKNYRVAELGESHNNPEVIFISAMNAITPPDVTRVLLVTRSEEAIGFNAVSRYGDADVYVLVDPETEDEIAESEEVIFGLLSEKIG